MIHRPLLILAALCTCAWLAGCFGTDQWVAVDAYVDHCSCAGKKCGGDDGCGRTCQVESCATGLGCRLSAGRYSCMCDVTTCSGCCTKAGDKCMPGNSPDLCGLAGKTCTKCPTAANDCLTRACLKGQCDSTVKKADGTSCKGASGTCANGVCCGGCLSGKQCVSGSASNSCGKGGKACKDCTVKPEDCRTDTCVSGVCENKYIAAGGQCFNKTLGKQGKCSKNNTCCTGCIGAKDLCMLANDVSAKSCGLGGTKCVACTTKDCHDTACTKGACVNTVLPDWSKCSKGNCFAGTCVERWKTDLLSATTEDLHAVWGTGASNVYAVGSNNTVVRYDGKVWAPRTVISGKHAYQDVWASSPTDIYLCGENGKLIQWDGNKTANDLENYYKDTIYGVWGLSSNAIWAVGQESSKFHIPYLKKKTTTMWQDDTDIYKFTYTNLWAVWAENPVHFYVLADSDVLEFKSNKWQQMNLPLSASKKLYDLWGTSSTNIYVTGSNNIYRYDGKTATAVWTSKTAHEVRAIWGSGASDIFAVGSAGLILHFNGTSWHEQVVDGSKPGKFFKALEGVWGTAKGERVFVVGEKGTIIQYRTK